MSAPNGNGNGVTKFVKGVPLAAWIAIATQIIGFGIWLVRMDARVSENDAQTAKIEARLNEMDVRDTRAGVLVSQRVYQIERTIEWLVAAQTGIRPPANIDPSKPPPGYRPEDKQAPTKDNPNGYKLQSEETRPYEMAPEVKDAMPPEVRPQ